MATYTAVFKTIEKHIVPSLSIFLGPKPVFMQNNAPCHASKTAKIL